MEEIGLQKVARVKRAVGQAAIDDQRLFRADVATPVVTLPGGFECHGLRGRPEGSAVIQFHQPLFDQLLALLQGRTFVVERVLLVEIESIRWMQMHVLAGRRFLDL